MKVVCCRFITCEKRLPTCFKAVFRILNAVLTATARFKRCILIDIKKPGHKSPHDVPDTRSHRRKSCLVFREKTRSCTVCLDEICFDKHCESRIVSERMIGQNVYMGDNYKERHASMIVSVYFTCHCYCHLEVIYF